MILTSDAATILRELDVVHPAAKLIVMASQQQEAEMGDATNMVIVLAGELLRKAEELLRMGLKTADIVLGYEKAQKFALETLEELVVDRVKDMRSQEELSKAIRTVVASKQSGSEDFLAGLVAEAVLAVLPKDPTHFNVDNIRVVKIMGSSLEHSKVIRGMVFGRVPDGSCLDASHLISCHGQSTNLTRHRHHPLCEPRQSRRLLLPDRHLPNRDQRHSAPP